MPEKNGKGQNVVDLEETGTVEVLRKFEVSE